MVAGRGIMGNATLIGRIAEGELSTLLKLRNLESIFYPHFSCAARLLRRFLAVL